MFFSRVTALSLLVLTTSSLARPLASENLIGNWASLEKRSANTDLEMRALSSLMDDLHALAERSAPPAELEERTLGVLAGVSAGVGASVGASAGVSAGASAGTGLAVGAGASAGVSAGASAGASVSAGAGASVAAGASVSGSASTSAGAATSAHATLSGHIDTCHKTIKSCGKKISAGVKGHGKGSSAASVSATIKAEITAIRVALTTLGKACVSLKAQGKGDLTVSIVASLVISLLTTVHAALVGVISLAASLPLLVVLLTGELLAISAQLVITLNALSYLVGAAACKAAVKASLSASVTAGFRTLGCGSIVALLV